MAGDSPPTSNFTALYRFEDLEELARTFDTLAAHIAKGHVLDARASRGAKLAFLLAASIVRRTTITGNDYDQSEEGGG